MGRFSVQRVPVEPVARGRTAAERPACTCASAAGELGLFTVGPVAAAAAVRRGGMACAAKKVRQPPEARPCRLWARMLNRATFVHGYKLPLLDLSLKTSWSQTLDTAVCVRLR
jgi:hypothetical protein